MEPDFLPFGGLFDLNHDGQMDAVEEYIAYKVISGEDDEEESGGDYSHYDTVDEADDD